MIAVQPARTAQATVKALTERVTPIDILRGPTMVLMIFVNDLWLLKNIPGWLNRAGFIRKL